METVLCAQCRLKPDRVLVLACGHHLCVGCAGGQVVAGVLAITCKRCAFTTPLEPSSGLELLRATTEAAPPSSPKHVSHCREHPSEAVRYQCNDCKGVCVCAECVIFGNHQGHSVKSVTKGGRATKETADTTDLAISRKINELSSLDKLLETSAYELRSQAASMTRQLTDSFQELHLLLTAKEKQLKEETNAVVDEHCTRIEYYRRVLGRRGEWLREVGERYRRVLDRNCLSEVQDFSAHNVDAIEASPDLSTSEMEELLSLGKVEVTLDISSAVQHIGSLTALKLQIEHLDTQGSRGRVATTSPTGASPRGTPNVRSPHHSPRSLRGAVFS